MSKKPQWLDRTLVVCPFYFTLATSEKAYRKAMKRFHIENLPAWLNPGADATTHSFEHGSGDMATVVCINADGASLGQVAGLLAHEAMHIWRWTLDHYGEKEPSFEFEAYSVQSLTQRLMEEYLRQTKNKKR